MLAGQGMARLAAALLATAALTACVDTLAQRRATLATKVGEREIDLVREFGVPTRTYDTDGHHFLAYVETYQVVDPGYWDPIMPIMTPPAVYNYSCTTTFEIANGTVQSFTLAGNGC